MYALADIRWRRRALCPSKPPRGKCALFSGSVGSRILVESSGFYPAEGFSLIIVPWIVDLDVLRRQNLSSIDISPFLFLLSKVLKPSLKHLSRRFRNQN